MRQKLISPFLMWFLILAGVALAFYLVPGGFIFHSTKALFVLLAVAVALWLYFVVGAMAVNRHVGSSVSRVQKIATSGVYGLLRHPIYFADIILVWAVFLLYPAYAMIVAVAWATLVFLVWAKLEEKYLEEKFGRDYSEYKKSTPMFWPKLRKKNEKLG